MLASKHFRDGDDIQEEVLTASFLLVDISGTRTPTHLTQPIMLRKQVISYSQPA